MTSIATGGPSGGKMAELLRWLLEAGQGEKPIGYFLMHPVTATDVYARLQLSYATRPGINDGPCRIGGIPIMESEMMPHGVIYAMPPPAHPVLNAEADLHRRMEEWSRSRAEEDLER